MNSFVTDWDSAWIVCSCGQSEGYEIYALVPGLAREEVFAF